MMKRKRSESGQALILVAIGFISLLGFAGLAIDGGRVFSERRNIQNVADTAAFAGALKIGRTSYEHVGGALVVASDAARARAADNGYDITDLTNPHGWVTVTVEIIEEDDSTSSYYIPGSPFYLVSVEITSHVNPTFIQLVYKGDLTTTAKAVARVHPKMPVGYGYSVVSLSDACDSFKISGGSEIDITGSGIFSNSTCSGQCESHGAVLISGASKVDLDGYEIAAPGDICGVTEGDLTDPLDDNPPSSINRTPKVPMLDLPEPSCDGLTAQPGYVNSDGEWVIRAGINYSLLMNSGSTKFRLEPGIHCIIGGLDITKGWVVGDGVTLIMVTGGVKINGGVLQLSAPTIADNVVDAAGNNWAGMLIYMVKSNDQTISIKPDEMSTLSDPEKTVISGTVYAPSPSFNPSLPKCSLSGSGSTNGYNMQMVCDTVELIGDSSLYLTYDESKIYFPPVAIDLVE